MQCPVSLPAMASRSFADSGGMDSDDDHANTGSQDAAAAAAAAHRRSVTVAAIAGSIQGSRPPVQRPPAIYVASSPPRRREWQTPLASSAGAAEMIPKPKGVSKAQVLAASAKAQTVLALAARSAAAAVEQLAKMASETVVKPGSAVSSEGGEQCTTKNTWDKAKGKSLAKAKIGATLPVLEHAAAADTAAPPKAAFLAPVSSAAAPKAEFRASGPRLQAPPATFAGRYPPKHAQSREGWDNMVRDYHAQREEDKKSGSKRKMLYTQAEWYTLHAESYGLQPKKKPVMMKKPSAHAGEAPAGSAGSSGSAPRASEEEVAGEGEAGEEEVDEGEDTADDEGEESAKLD